VNEVDNSAAWPLEVGGGLCEKVRFLTGCENLILNKWGGIAEDSVALGPESRPGRLIHGGVPV
jgi:hypothetical protein